MKHFILSTIALILCYTSSFAQELSPYIKVGESSDSMQAVTDQVMETLKANNFIVLGSYNVSDKNSFRPGLC